MSKQDMMKIQSCMLKVNIHCDGCEQKVKKLLQKIEGVYKVSIDGEEGKVVVSGNVDPVKLIKKLKSSGKHAELWGGNRGMMFNQNYASNPQFKNLQIDNSKGGKDNKPQNNKGQKGGGGGGGVQLAHFQNMKGGKDMKVGGKDQKSVKFNLEDDEFDDSDDGFDDDEFDDYDDEDEDEEYGHHGHGMHKKMMPMMGNEGHGSQGHGVMMMNGSAMNNNHKGNGFGGGGGAKKGDVIDLPIQMKGKGGNGNFNEGKNGNKGGEKQKGGGDGGDNNNSKKKKDGKAKSGGGFLVKFLGLGKKSKKGGSMDTTSKNKNNNGHHDGKNKGKESKKGGGGGGGKLDKVDFDFQDFDIPQGKNGKSVKVNNNGHGHHGGNNKGPMGQRGGPMEQMRNIPAVQGLPASAAAAINGGYHQGMHMQMQPNPYNNNLQQLQQQQYMAMMMQQQQQANMSMYPPQQMMYGRPHPSMNYMPPPPMPSHPMADPITHVFSDENTESCSIM
ncbi:hypothetical protein Lal_00048931 [Lupinus albus]|uniref:Putative heavy metal-associated domain, HMA n=1 Tax=Lupinus albus TaxID=3870 RepID=A0A6A5NEA9_LUPAL|nr:putative heavy metal-associated domain, HMA [Lupinus albus]KAF1880295.1 hypothetical protein Lal_00048931 [Lupinus albus]